MPMLSFVLNSIEAKKTGNAVKKLSIKTTPTIKDVKTAEIKNLGKEVLNIDFDYVCSYKDEAKKDVASIKIDGTVVFMSQDNKKALEDWKKGKLPQEIGIPVLNAIMRKCLIKTVELSDELQLPSPIRMPRVSPARTEKKK